MYLRRYQKDDCKAMLELFYNTVHTINIKDYTKEQCNAWTFNIKNINQWHQRFTSSFTVVAVESDQVIGFRNINEQGFMDMLYVHHEYQNRKIATLICERLEKEYNIDKIRTDA